jgi:hypothetical protein
MHNEDINALAIAWSHAKQAEASAINTRRMIEDKLTEALGIVETDEGVKNAETLDYKIKVTSRLTRKVDADLIQEAAAEHGLSHLLSVVCRWKPELDLKAWHNLPDETRTKLAPAITTSAGRPSYSITAITKE